MTGATKDFDNWLLFRVGPVGCAVPATHVDRIVLPPPHLTALPGSNAEHPGIFQQGDEAARVVDLRHKFGLDVPPGKPTGRMVMAHVGPAFVAFWVDSIISLLHPGQVQVAALPSGLPSRAFTGALLFQQEIILCSDWPHLMSLHEHGPLRRWIEQSYGPQDQPVPNTTATTPRPAQPGTVPRQRPPVAESQPAASGPAQPSPGKPPAPSHPAPPDVSPRRTERKQAPTNTKPRPTAPRGQAQRQAPATTPPRRPQAAEPTQAPRKPVLTPTTTAIIERSDRPSHTPETPPSRPAPATNHGDDEPGLPLLAVTLLGALTLAALFWLFGLDERLWPQQPPAMPMSMSIPAPMTTQPAPPVIVPLSPAPIEPPMAEPLPIASSNTQEPPNLADTHAAAPAEANITNAPPAIRLPKNGRVRVEEGEDGLTIIIESPTEAEPVSDVVEAPAASGQTSATEVETLPETIVAEASLPAHEPGPEPAPVNSAPELRPAPAPEPLPESIAPPMPEPGPVDAPELAPEVPTIVAPEPSPQPAPLPPTAPPKPKPAPQVIVHVVVKGDTLWAIAKRYLDDPWYFKELAKLSKIKNPDLIYPGNKVRIIIH